MRSHREIAQDLDLFHSEPEGPGMVFWHPNGWRLFQAIQNHMRAIYIKAGFNEVNTPILLKQSLWQTSGHLSMFADNMFLAGDSEQSDYAVKPMSCPAHILLFKRQVQSYRQLPYRIFEFGTVHRNESSGALNGCLRLRQFTQDDAHVFCRWQQAAGEVGSFLSRAQEVYRHYGYNNIKLKIATKPDQAYGDPALWQKAERLLAQSILDAGMEFDFLEGEGAFYGPKIEISLSDASGRQWQCGTIQLDFNLPSRFDADFIDEDNSKQRPVILHQAMYGSIERWIGILLEVSQGTLPLWMHPTPVALVTVSESALAYACDVRDQLNICGIWPYSDFSGDTLGRKIKLLHNKRIPLVLVIGEKEMEHQTVTVRGEGWRNKEFKVASFVEFFRSQREL